VGTGNYSVSLNKSQDETCMGTEADVGNPILRLVQVIDNNLDGSFTMRVNFYGTYRLITGGKTIEIPMLPGETLLDLLIAVAEKFPLLKDKIFDPPGNLYPYIPLYINGRNPRLLVDGVRTVIKPEDVISIFSPISSGRINVEDINKRQPVNFQGRIKDEG
jgi:molybdopterin converting factor small subunit